MEVRIFFKRSRKLIVVTIFLLILAALPVHAALWDNKTDINTEDFQRIVTELRIYDDPDLPYYNEIFRLYYAYYTGSEELLDALNKKIEITQQAMKILDADIKKEELGNLTYGRYILNAINEKELVEIGLKMGSSNQADGEYFSKLGENLADWESQLSKLLLTKIIVATCTAMGAPALSIGISTLGLFCDLSIIKVSINKFHEVWYEKAFWSYMQFRNEHKSDHIGAWTPYAEPYVNYIINLSLLSLEKQKKAREAIEENFKFLWDRYGDHIVNSELDKNFKTQQRESLKILLLYALGAEPHSLITSPLKITPSSPYQVGDIINAEFTITNQGKLPINFSVLTVGGRDPDDQVADFTHRRNIILEPSKSYNYKGTLTLNKVGDYHFFCTYQTPDDEWNTCVDLGSGLTDEDRMEDIIVKEKEEPSVVPTISEELYIEWDKTFGGCDNDKPYSIVQTNDGGYAVAGSTKSKGAGKLDAWIIKLDNKGNLEWDKTFGRRDNDEANSMIQTTDGGYVMAGYTYKSGRFFWIIKLDNKGNLEWDKTFGRSNNERAYSIIQTNDGGYAVVGSTFSSKKPGVTRKCIAWLIKLDDKGNKMWDKIFGRSDNDGVYYSIVQGGIQGGKAYSLIQTNDGGYVITALTSKTLERERNHDLWLIKLDDKGNKMWDKIFERSGANYCLDWSFIQTNDGGYATAGNISLKGEGGINAWLIKLDNKGNLEWDKAFGGSNRAVCSVIQTKDSGYALAGTKFEAPGVWNAWLIKLDNKGNLEWDKTFGGSKRDFIESLIQTNDGGYALVGLTESKGAGKGDVWVIKLSSKSVEALEEEVTAIEALEDKIEKEIPTEAFLNQTNHEKLSPNFVKLNNDLAIAIVKLEKKDEYNYITATIAIKKLSSSNFKYPLLDESAEVTLNLIDDQGEIFSTNYDFPHLREYLCRLPKGFVLTEEFSTSAPALALNHIKTINLLGQKVNLVELALGQLESFNSTIHATKRVQLNKWLDFRIDGIIDNALKDFQDLYIKGTIMNSSYDDKDVTINLSYQNKNGQLFYTDGASYKIGGKSSKVFVLSLGYPAKMEDVRVCLISIDSLKDNRPLFILPIDDKISFFYPPTINYTGGPARKYYKVFYDPPRLKTFSRPNHLNDFVWETKVEMHRVGYTSHAYFKFVMSFDKGEGTLIMGIYSNTGNPIEEDMHSGHYKLRPTIVFPDEATSASFYIDFSEKPRY